MIDSLHLRRVVIGLLACAAVAGAVGLAAARARTPAARPPDTQVPGPYVPGEVVVGYTSAPHATTALARRMGIRAAASSSPTPDGQVISLPGGVSVTQAVAELRRTPGVAYAVPNYIAHADGGGARITGAGWIPDDPGRTRKAGGWQRLQWNFLPGAGVDAPEAWRNLIADHRPGGRGVVIAVLDTGIAYRNWHQFRESPDFKRTRFVAPYDFVAHNRFPLDRNGHGTFVTGTIAESTNNRIALTGLAYGASIMPVRVLDQYGTGNAETIARGIRYAVAHHAQVINLSLEFTPGVTATDIPGLMSAIRFADSKGVVVVGAAGNDYGTQVAYPARASSVISVGATTRDRCLAEYSNGGSRLDLVAPGGGSDKYLPNDPDCHPGRPLSPIYQLTFFSGRHPDRFGYPGGIEGTSMSTPHVAAAAALVIASGVLGPHPTPAAVRARLEQTAQPLGTGRPNTTYGWGLLDAGRATVPTPAAAAARR